MKCFKVTGGTMFFVFFPLKLLIPLTILLKFLLRFPSADPSQNSTSFLAIIMIRIGWIHAVLFALWCFISGEYKRIILRINNEGVAYSHKGYLYEYEWPEIEYLRDNFYLGRLQLFVKAYDEENEHFIDLESYMWTLLPVRKAFKRYSKGRATYYTRRKWKQYQLGNQDKA